MKQKVKQLRLRKATKNKLIDSGLVAGFYLIVMLILTLMQAFGISGGYQLRGMLMPIGAYLIFALSLNLTVGVLGELSLGHAGFICIGAYTGGIFSILTESTIPIGWLRLLIALIVGGLSAALAGLLIGIPILRLRGDYLAIVTLAFGEIIRKVVQSFYIVQDVNGLHVSFTKPIDASTIDQATQKVILNGPMAMQVPQNATILLVAILAVLTVIVLHHVIDSRQGRAFMAVRDNLIAAESIGINVTKYKLIAFVISALFAGIGGVLFAHFNTVDPTKFDYNMSIMILVFVVLGGLGNLRGTIIATIFLYMLPEWFRPFSKYRMLFYAIVLIVMMILTNSDSPWVIKLKETVKGWFRRKGKTLAEDAHEEEAD